VGHPGERLAGLPEAGRQHREKDRGEERGPGRHELRGVPAGRQKADIAKRRIDSEGGEAIQLLVAAGRVGNFINGELWGKPTDVPWGFAVPQPDGTTAVLHASQLYQAALEGLLLFAILWWFTSRPRPRWAPSGLFLVGYAVFRIAVEFVRVPDADLGYLAGGWLTMGMLLSVGFSLVQTFRGLYAEIPTISEAVHMQVR